MKQQAGDPDGPDRKLLRGMYQEDKTARALFDHLAKRVYNYREQKVERLLQSLTGEGLQTSRGDITRVLKELERARCGEYVVGRKGHPSRFRWDVEMVAVGQYAAGTSTDIGEVDPGTGSEDDVSSSEPEPAQTADTSRQFTHRFPLRSDLVVSLDLPVDLTAKEAARLADFIKALPIDPHSDDLDAAVNGHKH